MLQIRYVAAALLLASACEGAGCEEICPDPWEAAVEDWATAARGNLTRHGRIMSLPPAQGYYVSDRIDLTPPPPPPHHSHSPHSQMHHRGPYPMPGKRPPSPAHHPPGPPTSGAQSGPPGNSYNPSDNSYNYYNPPSENSYNSYQPSAPNQSSPPGGPNHSTHSGPQNSLSGSSQYGPSGNPQNGPSGNPHNGPLGNLQNGPSGNPQNGPSGNPHNGPSGNPQNGPSGQQNTGPPVKGSPPDSSMSYDEWPATPPPPPGAGKIVNRPANPYKDQFKPSYAPPSPRPIPVSADRVDAAPPPPPQKQVSETDLYLLRAIEKLVYRVDLMEKRMRKMEENMHLIVAGTVAKPEPCLANFTRLGPRCYHVSSEAANWKSASYACRKLKANLLELQGDERRQFVDGVLADRNLRGVDFWTGGLNPGLLWIWSHSAKPVAGNGTESAAVVGEGRCLALVSSPAHYEYRGQDCSLRHRYVCERDDDGETLSNEIERVARGLREGRRKPKIAWD